MLICLKRGGQFQMADKVTTDNIFEDLGFSSVEAENLKVRAQLMRAITKYIQNNQLTQQEAADMLHVTQPRISNLMNGKIDLFTIDMLVNMLSYAKIHFTVSLDYKKAA